MGASCAFGAVLALCRRRSSRPPRWTSAPLGSSGGSSGTLFTTPRCTSSAAVLVGGIERRTAGFSYLLATKVLCGTLTSYGPAELPEVFGSELGRRLSELQSSIRPCTAELPEVLVRAK